MTYVTSELSEFAASFRLSDIVQDGYVTYVEVARILKRLGLMPDQNTLKKLINTKIDPEGRGVFDFQTMLRIIKNYYLEPATEEVLREAFTLFDQDKSGIELYFFRT